MNEEEVRIAKETLEALFSDSTGEDYPYTEKFGQAVNTGIQALEELEQYRALGTVEELKEAREKQVAKKPIEYEDKYYACPRCEGTVMYKWDEYPTKLKSKKYGLPYCLGCGQKLDWSEEDD